MVTFFEFFEILKLEAPKSEKSMPWYMAEPTQYKSPTKGKKNVQQKQPAL